MRKFLLASLVAASAAFAGCQDDIDAPVASLQDEGSVQFSTYVGRGASRAAVTTTDNLNAFGVFGYMGGTSGFDPSSSTPDFMYNQEVLRDGSSVNTWHYSPVKYWPQDDALKTAFFAYAPYTASSDIAPAASEAATAVTAVSANTDAGNPTIRYHVGTNVLGQQDLVFASTGDLTNKAKTVDLEFQHALSRVAFKVKGWEADDPNSIYGTGTTVTVNSVKLATKRKEATLDLGTGAWSDPDNSTAWRGYAITPAFGMVANAKSDAALEENDIFQIGSGSTEVMNLTADDGYVMLLPEIDPADNDKYMLFVDYTVRTEDDALAGGFVEYRNNVYRFFTPHFEQGKAYAITIHLGMNGTPGDDDGDYDEPFDPADEPDNDPENPAHPAADVAEIAFTQVVIDWDEAADKNLNFTGDHRYVDLGLPSGTLWAACNLGASNPEDLGDFYAWGQTTPSTSQSWNDYMCTESQCGTADDPLNGITDIAGTQWDAAYLLSAGREVMPSIQQCSELANYCNEEEVTVNGKACLKLTSKINGNCILLPKMGITSGLNGDPAYCPYFWSSSQYSYTDERKGGNTSETAGRALRYASKSCVNPYNYVSRYNLYSIRPVLNSESSYAYPEWLHAEIDENGNIHCELFAQNGRHFSGTVSVLVFDKPATSGTMVLATALNIPWPENNKFTIGGENVLGMLIDTNKDYYVCVIDRPTQYYSNPIRFTEEMLDLGDENNTMAFTVRTTTANEVVSLPFVNDNSPTTLRVKWGDNSDTSIYRKGVSITDANKSHTYAEAGDYTITIVSAEKDVTKQQVPEYGNTESLHFPKQLVSVNTPLLHSGQTSLRHLFYHCSALTSIPAGLFDHCTEVTNFQSTFVNCSGLTSIPAGLFDNCSEAEYFSTAFANCSGLSSIPAGLFDHCTEAKSFDYVFNIDSELISIPAGLFDNCTKVRTFYCSFGRCAKLAEIPEHLFDHCTEVTDFSYAFEGCSGLSSIPAGLFDNCTKVKYFGGAFWGCSGLQSISEGLFDHCSEVECFSRFYQPGKYRGVFEGCSGITSAVPELWDSSRWPNVTTSTSCFYGCTNAANYDDIPSGWK